MDYEPTLGDEVEDIVAICEYAKVSRFDNQKERYKELDGITCGAILSEYQKKRIEYVYIELTFNRCSRLNLQLLTYLWGKSQFDVLSDLVNRRISSIIVKTATLGISHNMTIHRIG